MQKTGVCTGSCLAPLLSDLLLARKLKGELSATNATKVFRYVDDFLVLYERPGGVQDVDHICGIFESTLCGLVLTRELPINADSRI